MPTVKRFDRSRITMYFNDHAPPHFHILANNGSAAMYAIETMACFAGFVDARDAEEALSWAAANRATLWAAWKQYSESE